VPDGGTIEAPRLSPLQMAWRQLRRNRLALTGLAIFAAFFWIAVLGVVLTTGAAPYLDPAQVRLVEKLRPPMSRPLSQPLAPAEQPRWGIFLLGTDDLGRDVFARMLQGAWVSLTVGFVAVGIAILIGIVLGGIAGYYGARPVTVGHVLAGVVMAWGVVRLTGANPLSGSGGILLGMLIWAAGRRVRRLPLLSRAVISTDTLITGLIDIMLCFPSFFLVLTVVALLPPSIYNIMAVIGLTSWMGAARFVRADFLSLREQDFVKAARALGLSDGRIIFRHMVPNALAPVLVSATIGIASAILTEAGLSFLGFGVPPPHATWGNILSDGKNYLMDAPWLTIGPGIAILVVVLAFNLFGEGLRESLNPRLRERS
jgi:peptide/nickel transport system permease protein